MIIIQQRIPVPPLYASRTGTKKVNMWVSDESGDDFNLDLDDTDAFREELSLWKNADVYRRPPPPLIIETYIDVKDLTANQTLVLLDEEGRRWNVDTTKGSNIDVTSGPRKASRVTEVKPEVILERWFVELRPRNDGVPAPQLAVAYKHGVVLFRSLYTYAGLMPTQKLLRRLAKVKVHQSALKVCCRIVSGETSLSSARLDGLNVPFMEGESQVTDRYSLGSVDTPAGEMHINVFFRRHCDFRVDDSEELLSSHFLNMDERYFQPSLNTHQRTVSQPQSLTRRDLGSVPSAAANAALRSDPRQDAPSYGLYQHGTGVITASPGFAARGQQVGGTPLSSSPADQPYMNLRSVQGSKSSLRSVDNAGIQRRPSVSFMQPFKSPSLSNSPSSDAIPPSPRTSLTRITSTTAPIAARTRATISPVAPKSSLSYDSTAPLGTSASPKPQSIGRYSSSFGPRKPRPAIGRMEDETSSGKGSYSSSMQAPGSGMFNEQRFSYPSEDQKVADFIRLLDDKQPLKLFDHGDSSKKTNSALVKFQQMRESHNALSDSMSASIMLQRTGSPSTPSRQSPAQPVATPSSYSPSSSPGKPVSPYPPHTPAVPSRLSHTAVYTSRNPPSREDTGFDTAQHSPGVTRTSHKNEHSTAAAANTTTSPLDIPAPSPHPFQPVRRPSSTFPPPQEGFDNDSSEFEGPVFGPNCSGVDVPLSHSKIVELQIASETDMPGRENAAHGDVTNAPREEGERGEVVQRGGFSGGNGTGSSESVSYRGRGYRGAARATSTYTPSSGSLCYLRGEHGDIGAGGDRPLLVGIRTPSYPRGGFGEEEDLLFAMSDMSNARRSIDQEHGEAVRGVDGVTPSPSSSGRGPQRSAARDPPSSTGSSGGGGGSGGSRDTGVGRLGRW
ncbi:autophagy-related protein 13-domain-containing protein [Kalaharituber pfeilii]|nr:autophagy-related protein 13-domain-containing protein [Kalaharituber pfeilii]